LRIAACPVQADVAVVIITDEPMRTDGTAFDVTGKVTNGGVAASDVLELPDPSQIGFDRTLAQTFELYETAVILIPKRRSECVVFFA
jgi:hypothetical protein